MVVPGHGPVRTDVSFGGAFYALADARQFGLEIGTSRVRDLVDAATALSAAVNKAMPILHPVEQDLGFLYGRILNDGRERPEAGPSVNICVFADAEVDRSPTGSGVTARMAARFQRGLVAIGEECEIDSVTGARFTGAEIRTTNCGANEAVVVRVIG